MTTSEIRDRFDRQLRVTAESEAEVVRLEDAAIAGTATATEKMLLDVARDNYEANERTLHYYLEGLIWEISDAINGRPGRQR